MITSSDPKVTSYSDVPLPTLSHTLSLSFTVNINSNHKNFIPQKVAFDSKSTNISKMMNRKFKQL